jgi:hypothetical protein
VHSVVLGALAMASAIAALFFLRFWRQTRDSFFLFFAFAFATDAVLRVGLAYVDLPAEHEPLFYLGRLLTFVLILGAIIHKNRPGGRS